MSGLARRIFLKKIGLVSFATAFIPGLVFRCAKTKQLPNILWITSEDNGPFLGCYGDHFATTTNLDRFAHQGILYKNAFATVPVCAPARNTIITGVYPPSMGTQHMRSRYPIPDFIKPYPLYLRAAGYYCTNNSKTDYNLAGDDKACWDECSDTAHYNHRAPGQPFFAIFNFTVSHESSIHISIPTEELRHDPARVTLPPYHPDTPEIRHDWAQYYDKVEDLDIQVGKVLQELEDEGLAADTIVFYYSDHGGVLARSKRFLYDSGLHVPMIIRFPPKYQHLAPARPGTATDRIVTFVDLPATLLSLVGVPIPGYMQGSAFLGNQVAKPRRYAQSLRGRMDERYDFSRTLRDKQFRYTRNFNPHRIYGQYLEYLWRAPATRSWEQEYRAGRCNKIQSKFWQPKPFEELYDSSNDPWEVTNLATAAGFKKVLERMRKHLRQWQLEIRDSGFLPEGRLLEISKTGTIYDYVHSDKYSLERIIDTAYMATDNNATHLPTLIERSDDLDATVRFWAATGCLVLGNRAGAAMPALQKLLNDADGDVVAVAAEALTQLGLESEGINALVKLLDHENSKVILRALNALTALGPKAGPAVPAIQHLLQHPDNYVQRAANYLVGDIK